jgi:alpha-galactosidase
MIGAIGCLLFFFFFFFFAAFPSCCDALDNGVALTPPRGFSTWNAFPVHSIDEKTCYSYMNSLVAAGLNKLNYTYFIVDEPCFTGRAADGTLIENRTTWPNGIKKFGAALRSHGMKLGIYTCVGPKTCGGCIASQDHEEQDVAT